MTFKMWFEQFHLSGVPANTTSSRIMILMRQEGNPDQYGLASWCWFTLQENDTEQFMFTVFKQSTTLKKHFL